MTESVTLQHDDRVRAVAAQLRARAASTESGASGTVHIAKGGVHHVVPLPTDRRFTSARIDTSALRNILSIDAERGVAVCEPGVTFEELVRATLPLGLAPTVVPELRGITVGGAIAGCSVESMSFRHGGFHDSCLAYEVVGGDGSVHQLSTTDQPDLFHHVHGSYGTLGILTKIEFRLVPAKAFVAVTYRRFTTLADYQRALVDACDVTVEHEHDLVDGIVFAADRLVLCLGRFVDEPPPGQMPSDYTGEHIFYRSVDRLEHDVMTTEQYFFRYDTECHWLTRTVPPLEWRWVRRLVGSKVLGSTNLISLSNKLAPLLRRVRRRPDLVCDIFIPTAQLGEFFDWYRRTFDFWPLWVVPYRPPAMYPWMSEEIRERNADVELMIDLAIYGARNTRRDRDLSVLLEAEVFRLGGLKTLIGRNHYDEQRFWEIYDRDAYDKAKVALDPTGAFPNLYDKLGRV